MQHTRCKAKSDFSPPGYPLAACFHLPPCTNYSLRLATRHALVLSYATADGLASIAETQKLSCLAGVQ